MQIVSQEEFIWQTQGRTLTTINRSTLIDWLINCLPVAADNCCFAAAMEQSNIKLFEKFHRKDWVRWWLIRKQAQRSKMKKLTSHVRSLNPRNRDHSLHSLGPNSKVDCCLYSFGDWAVCPEKNSHSTLDNASTNPPSMQSPSSMAIWLW